MDTILDWLDSQREAFGIGNIRNAGMLARSTRTGYPWGPHVGTICLALKQKYVEMALRNPAITGIVAVPPAVERLTSEMDATGKAVISAGDAEGLFFLLHNRAIHERCLAAERWPSEIDASARIAPSAIVPEWNVRIGPRVEIGPNCVLYEYCVIGEGSTIVANSTIGAPAFFVKQIRGHMVAVRHFGGVVIGRGCTFYPGSSVLRATHLGHVTHVGDEVNVGPLSLVGHDVTVGDRAIVAGNVLIAGRAVIGHDSQVWASATICQDRTVGHGARVNVGAVVVDDVPDGATVSGNFATDHAARMAEHRASALGRGQADSDMGMAGGHPRRESSS